VAWPCRGRNGTEAGLTLTRQQTAKRRCRRRMRRCQTLRVKAREQKAEEAATKTWMGSVKPASLSAVPGCAQTAGFAASRPFQNTMAPAQGWRTRWAPAAGAKSVQQWTPCFETARPFFVRWAEALTSHRSRSRSRSRESWPAQRRAAQAC
jgi:hypothetical protein